MACFLVPAAEAVVTTVATKLIKSKEKSKKKHQDNIPFSVKLGWLNKMLWGGSALLAFEHVWNGELVPVFPFLTAIENGETAEMLAEMGTNGVLMAALITAVWAGMVLVSNALSHREEATSAAAQEND